jgi:hypothetical protein
MCGVSTSTIRRYLSAGRFPGAQQQPSPIPSRRGAWRIPTKELLAADLRPPQARRPDKEQKNQPSSRRTAGQPVDDRVRELEHALELERIRRRAAEDLAAERAHTIYTLENALRALQVGHAAPVPPSGPRRALARANVRRNGHARPSAAARHVADGAKAKAGQARTQPGGEGGHHRDGAHQATATQTTLAVAASLVVSVQGDAPQTGRKPTGTAALSGSADRGASSVVPVTIATSRPP